MTDTCSTCRYFLSPPEPGVCRRYPPAVRIDRQIVAIDKGDRSVSEWRTDVTSEFPRMQPHGWCGEWAGRVQ